MSRKADIDALIAVAEGQFTDIRAEYDASLQKQAIDPMLQVNIKNFCENLRSALDYIAHDLRERYCSGAPKDRFYFPILPDRPSFDGQAGKWFPGLEANAGAVWNTLLDVQPFQPGMMWLGQFSKLNNENKHGNLVPQSRKETTQHTVKTPDGGTIKWNPAGARFGSMTVGGRPVTKPFSSEPSHDPRLQTSTTVWVDFVFDGIRGSAIELLQSALNGVKAIVAGCQPHLWV